MHLVFKDFINFMEDNGLDNSKYKLKEGYYWFDKMIVKCFDKTGELHKVVRLHINDDLTIRFSGYKDKAYEIESWEETVLRNEQKLKELEENSLKLISDSIKKYENHTVAILTSGGKDSVLTDYLVGKITNTKERIFNNTTLDCADTYLYIKSLENINIITPKEGFYQWQKRLEFVPTRFSRACCSIFKEGETVKQLDKNKKYLFFMGMRNSESKTRENYGDEWKNTKWGNREWQGILAIRQWEEIYVWLYIIKNKIHINSKYKKGYNRVGCAIACPYQTKLTWCLDKYWYTVMYERWHNILEKDFINNKKSPIMNCTLEEYHRYWNAGVVRDEANEEIIQEFAEHQNLDIEIAKKYFNKQCTCCNKKLKKDDIGLSMKFYGRQIEKFKCSKCLAKDLGTTAAELKERAKTFKKNGCDLF